MNLGRAEARDMRVPARRLRRALAINERALQLGLFVGLVLLGGAASLAVPSVWRTSPERWVPAFAVLTVVAIFLEFRSVPLPKGGSVTIATIAHVATILLVPAPFAAISVGASVLVEETARRAPRRVFAFNVGGMLLTTSLCSLAIGLTGDVWAIRGAGGSQILLLVPFVVVGLVYHGVNLVLTSVAMAMESGRSVGDVLRINTRGTLLNDAGAATVGALVALIWTVEPVLATLLTLPGAVVSRSFEHTRRLEVETRSAVRSLADIIDDRDATTFHHSERVAVFALAIGKELGLVEDELEMIEQAAAVHDLGKIGIPDRVLLNPGPLTDEELTVMRLHTEIGPRILSQFALFREGSGIVRHHHESFDGSGYPDGLAGDAIPYGARVVAVADAFDAMTSDRPYRSALSVAEALKRLRSGRGAQWDPTVVDAFLQAFTSGAIEHDRRVDERHDDAVEHEADAARDADVAAWIHDHGASRA